MTESYAKRILSWQGGPDEALPSQARALIIVDVQVDFLPGGALAVPRGDEVVRPIAGYASYLRAEGSVVVATADWHPVRHSSFDVLGGPWPVHCVGGSYGARSHPALSSAQMIDHVFFKGTDPEVEAYSGFHAEDDLETYLKARGTREVIVVGLATDYCVKATALDARRRGFDVTVPLSHTRGVEADTTSAAINEMIEAGVTITRRVGDPAELALVIQEGAP